MGGREARDGFWFQDAKALTRLLDDAIERRRRRLLGLELSHELRVRVESPVAVVVDDSGPEADRQPPRPAWDGTFTVGDRVTVEECKLGGPTRDDRVTFYRRLRETIENNVPIESLVPRLTAGRDSITDPAMWRELAVAAQAAAPPTSPPGRVDTVEKLAAEALYYLTTPEPLWKLKNDDEEKGERRNRRRRVVTPAALSLANARSLLARFELDAESTIEDLDARLRAQLETIGATLLVDELVDQLRGWIDRVARTREWQGDLTADTLSDQLSVIARYTAVPASVEQFWHRLREARPPAPETRIVEQPWRDVQPAFDTVVHDRAASTRVAVTSEGGIGKSYLLCALHAEEAGTRLWVDTAAPLDGLEEALALGAWAMQRSNSNLTVFVDTIDQVADPAALLATIDRALDACERAVVYAGVRFATWATIRDRVPKWRGVRLEKWTDARIRAIAETGRAEPLSADLIDLLRTPLLLDLFLRTFATDDPIPAGLATRHGVLRAYFERRVLVEPHATERRAVLDAGVEAVLANTPVWRDASTAAKELVSEGVVTRTLGELRFRHALLRDFAAALRLMPTSSTKIAADLRGVVSPIIRNELLRGVIEAVLDPDPIYSGPTVEDLIRECTRCGLAPGIALGTTDAPTAALLTAIASIDDGAVLRQALAHAQLIENRAWLRVPSLLGPERPTWFGTVHLEAMARLAELALKVGDSSSSALASTLRAWTWGQRVETENAWSISRIGELLVRAVPDDMTVLWYESLVLLDSGFRSRFLEPLRDLGGSTQVTDGKLLSALGKIVFGPGSHVLAGGHSLWEVTNLCISGHDGKAGLLSTRPHVALTLVFQLCVARELDEKSRRCLTRPDPVLAEFLAKLPPPPQDYVDAEARLRIQPTLTETEAIGDLVDDAPITDYRGFDYLESVIDDVVQLASDDPTYAEVLANVATASRSVRARIIALGLRGPGRVDQIGVAILRDSRVYHFRYAEGALWDALHERWSTLSQDVRVEVQKNILAAARSPLVDFTSVGRLATAIPREELDAALRPYVEFLEETGRPSAPTRPARTEFISRGLDNDEGSDEQLSPTWRRFQKLANKVQSEQTAAEEAISILQQELATLNDQTPDSTWFAVSRVVGHDEKRKQRTLGAEVARTLFGAALAACESRRSEAGLWATLVDIIDACPSYVPEDEALVMRQKIIAEVGAGAGEHAEHGDHAWRAIHSVRPAAWFSDGTGGRELFERWFRNHLHGEALKAGLMFLQFLPGNTRIALIRYVVETEGRLRTNDEARAFLDDVGRLMAAWSLWWTQDWAREVVRDWCVVEQRPGALANANGWRSFVSGFAWSLQNEIRHAAPDPRREPGLARFAKLVDQAWSAWQPVIDDAAQDNTTVGWSVLAPLSQEFDSKLAAPSGGWSVALREVVARVIAKGGRNDLSAFHHVDWAGLDSETLALLANTTIERADHEITSRPASDWMIDELINILGAIGRHPSLQIDHARRVLDCLQRLGRSAPRAVGVALAVERELRTRES